MANLTIAIEDNLLQRARLRATEQGRSINALLREYLEAFAGSANRRDRAIDSFQKLADRAATGSGSRRWSRDELHER